VRATVVNPERFRERDGKECLLKGCLYHREFSKLDPVHRGYRGSAFGYEAELSRGDAS
jgi:hypothetical protein